MIGDRKVDIPSYTVTVEEENSVHFAPESKIPEMLEKTKSKDPAADISEEQKFCRIIKEIGLSVNNPYN